jgi:23S rRNA pseudouridine955/2504/2580 synthase
VSEKNQSTGIRHGVRIVEVKDDAAGQRIDNFLSRMLKDVPKSRIYKMIRKGEVRVNGGRVKPTVKLRRADQVRVPPVHVGPAASPAFIGSRALEMLAAAILYEDDRLLVLNKPAGIAVHGGSGVSYGVIEGLRGLQPEANLELVHRLDRETSGCLLIAKRRSMLRALHEQMREGAIGKHYQVIVRGHWPDTLRRVDAPLHKYVAASGERRVRVGDEGKPSLTTFAVGAHAAEASLISAELHTGRTHQIRVHCQLSGHGVLGDDKYATDDEREWDRSHQVGRLCLHAGRIVLPDGGGTFEAPLPPDFQRIWQRLERAGSGSAGPEDG